MLDLIRKDLITDKLNYEIKFVYFQHESKEFHISLFSLFVLMNIG